MKLSVVIPCYNEEEVIELTYRRTSYILKNLIENKKIRDYELIFVDDGSVDNTVEILKKLALADQKIKIVVLTRNFGHQAALMGGLYHAAGDIVVSMDADMQDPPEVIEQMIDKFREGYDVVYGVREKTKGDSLIRHRICPKLFFKLIKLFGINLIEESADFRLLSRKALLELKKISETNIFLRGIIPYLGFNYAIVRYKRGKRAAGKPSYSFKKSLFLAWEGITSFSYKPLRLATLLGFFCFFLSFAGIIWVLLTKFLGLAIKGWASIILVIFFLNGVQLIFLGLIGEYIGKIYLETKRRPLFIIKEII